MFWDTIPERQNDFYVITQSASGKWFCSLMTAYSQTVSFSATSSVDAAELCIPELSSGEEA